MLSYISNFNSGRQLIILIVITAAILTFVECYYRTHDVAPFYSKKITDAIKLEKRHEEFTLILGDSRAEAGLVPQVLKKELNWTPYNLGMQGVYNGYFYWIQHMSLNTKRAIIAVSPYSLFGPYSPKKEKSYPEWFEFFLNPSQRVEEMLTRPLNRHTRLTYGFSDFFDLINYGKVSRNYSPNGWNSYDRLGSDELFTSALNLYAYKYRLLENHNNQDLIKARKALFERMILEMKNDGIEIFLTRLPTSIEIARIEKHKFPWFDKYIVEISNSLDLKYLINPSFVYPKTQVDGSHLNRNAAIDFTKWMANQIKKQVINE